MSEKDKIRPHEADGIQEYDNALPGWWLGLFYFCIAFSFVYMIYYHVLGGTSIEEQLQTDQALHQERLLTGNQKTSEEGVQVVAEAKTEEDGNSGKKHYDTNCVPCHGAKGEGGVGPNLADNYWLHGGSREKVRSSIAIGIPAKGMPGWEAILGAKGVNQVLMYVESLQGTNPPNAKSPQGEQYNGD